VTASTALGKLQSYNIKYSRKRKAYRCFNMTVNKIVERINVQIDETSVPNPKEERKDSQSKKEKRI
jgi:hypothetical protein